jgi:uncharacterized membrane protein YdcZ (DUF606 family)
VDNSGQVVGRAGVVAVGVLLATSFAALRVIWLLTTQPETFASLTTADNLWTFVGGLVTRFLAII